MTWLEAISELCRQLDSESAIDSILTTAVDENMITFEQAQNIAYEVHLMGTQFSPPAPPSWAMPAEF
jgi:hypothetical protein